MEFRILGPLEVHSDGKSFHLGGYKQRALLAVLLLEANSVVSKDRLIDALWEDEPPESAQKALHVHLSGLRKLLGKDRLETRPPGYLLRVSEDELDLERFRRLREEGRLAEALALWRGPPLSDFAHQGFAQPEIARLEEQRLACIEERIDLELAAGRHTELTGELDALVAANPLRESLRGQLMLALYRSERQAEALEEYQQARTTLVDELGIEPGKPLRDLHQAILNQDSALDLPPLEEQAPQSEAEPIEETYREPQSVREVRKSVTALFVGVSISSVHNRTVDPEALRRVTSRAVDVVKDGGERHGGMLETVGSTATATLFGLPVVHEDDALRAVRAAWEVRDQLTALSSELENDGLVQLDFRIGISTGEVVAGGESESIGAIGEPLTRSAALAQASAHRAILIDDPTRRLLRGSVVADQADDGWRVVELAGDLVPLSLPASPMVGRERERRRLRDAFDQAAGDRSCQLFTVLGPAGVGKSRLVHEFLGDIAGQALVARGRCLPYGEGITYWPLLEAVKEAVGLDDGDSPEMGRAKLVAAFGDEEGAEDEAGQVAETIGLAEAATAIGQSFAAIRALFEALARRQAVVLVFDDIHWGQPIFVDLVEHIADWTRDVPILLVCLARPDLLDLRPGWGGGKLNATSILLEPLSETQSLQLIDNLAGAALAEPIRRRVVEVSEGNPLFVEEMLALALEEGRPAGELDVPATIQSLLATRLDGLEEEERAVIDVAAVQGKVFYEDALTALLPSRQPADITELLGLVLRKELIRPDRPRLGGRAYRFRHLLIRDAAYESIPKEARSELHEGFARWLERAAGERATEYSEIVGYHLEQSYRYRAELGSLDDPARAIAAEAAERLGASGRRAFLRSDGPAGINLISRAASLLPPDDPRRVDLIPNVRAVQGTTDLSWADKVLTEAVEAAATSGDRRLAAQALVQRGLLRLFTDAGVTPGELIDISERATAVFAELDDDLGLARAWRLRAQAHYLDRNLAQCAEDSEGALEHARRARDRLEEQENAEWLMIALLLGPARASDAARRCRLLFEQAADNRALQAQVLASLGALLAMQGDAAAAEECVERSRTLLEASGGTTWIVTFWQPFVYLWRNDPIAAENEIRPGYEALKRLGERSHFSSHSAVLSRSLYLQGRNEEAEELTRECEAASRPNDGHSQIMWRAVRAKLLARKGYFEEAEELALASLAIAEDSDLDPAHADALMDFAEVLELSSRSGEAADAVREAIVLYEKKENNLATAAARERLAQLEG